MFQKIIIFIMILTAVIFQGAVLVNFFPAFAVPDALLVLVALWTVRNGFEKTLPRAILAGLMLDLAYFWPIGINIICLSVISYLASFLAKRFLVSQRSWKFIFLLILTVASTIFLHLLYYFISSLLSLANQNSEMAVSTITNLSIVYKIGANLAVLFLFYWPVKKIENFLSLFGQSVISQKR